SDGALSSAELKAAVDTLTTRLQTNFLTKYDTNKDGSVSSAEALAVSQSIVTAEVQAFLNTYDVNKDGSVTRAEIIAVLETSGGGGGPGFDLGGHGPGGHH